MKQVRIKNTEHPLFAQVWKLYKQSFPPEERRQLRTQKKIMDNPLYHFEALADGDEFVGFILWWKFDGIRYVEHLATLPRLRGKGYGMRILRSFISESDIPVLLEVERPTNDISRRRIGFYKRSGFVFNEQDYKHPPYKKGGEYVSLMLMTYPDAITESMMSRFLEEYHPVIHEFVLNSNPKSGVKSSQV